MTFYTISVDSEVGKGSSFTVRIPMRIAEELDTINDAEPKVDIPEAVDFSNLRVLLIEDHPVNILVAKRLLEKCGAKVDTAENGSIGYDMLTQSANGRYNLIFMDIQMPVMNGYDSAKAIRASAHPQAKSIPIIAMTANAFDEDIQKSKEAGMNAHLAKPIDPQLMYQTMFDFTYVGRRQNMSNRNDALRTYGVDLKEVMERFVNDEELYNDCLNSFIDDSSFDGLYDALLAKEYETAFNHAHTLKGVAGNLGLSPLLTAITDIVEPLRNHDYSNLEQQYDEIRTERERLRLILNG